MQDVEMRVQILNLTYVFRGFQSLLELKEFCDEHASAYPSNDAPEWHTYPESPSVQPSLTGNGATQEVETTAQESPDDIPF
jgi:hypothetical protein